jgi:hypothetical protein
MKRKQCQAHIITTNARCSKQAMRGSRYCSWHQSKGILVFSLVAGAILSLAISELWRIVVPSQEKKEIMAFRQDYSKSLKEPLFRLFLNGHEVFDRSIVAIPTMGDVVSLDFTIQNSGTLMAEHLKMSIKFPHEIPALHTTGFWKAQKASYVSGDTVKLLDDKSYIIEAKGTFAPNDTFGCSQIVVRRQIVSPESYPVHTKITAMKSEPHYLPFTLFFLPGITEPFVTKTETENVQPATGADVMPKK